jgi:mRNA interferase MazF
MKRGDIYDARLQPTEGSEQSGIRPVLIVSRNAINHASPVIVIVPLTDAINVKRQYPNNVAINKGEGGLTLDSVALTGQIRAISKTRLRQYRGSVLTATMNKVDRAMKITLDLL